MATVKRWSAWQAAGRASQQNYANNAGTRKQMAAIRLPVVLATNGSAISGGTSGALLVWSCWDGAFHLSWGVLVLAQVTHRVFGSLFLRSYRGYISTSAGLPSMQVANQNAPGQPSLSN
ncbi:hypothetical protein KCP78_11460 [Salmonella enterica subsp. enterica]|nr:hypothetical protein KCP78_11460 [Salmonella enterica subsp. enterica]